MPKSYGQFCPLAQACEILNERWTLLVIRELLAGSHRFSAVERGVPRMSAALLTKRLETLQRSGIVEKRPVEESAYQEYHLTEAGEQLRPIVESLGVWGDQYARRELREEHLDAGLLMWDIRRGVRPDEMPADRAVVKFEFWDREADDRFWWLIIEGDQVDLCLEPPGFEADVVVEADLRELTEIWLDDVDVSEARDVGELDLDGDDALVRTFADWFSMSPMLRDARLVAGA